MARQLVNKRQRPPPAASISATSSSCMAASKSGLPRVGQVHGAVQQRLVVVVERAAHVDLVVGTGGQARAARRAGRDGGAGQDGGRRVLFVPERS